MLCPMGFGFKNFAFTLPGEADAAGEEHRFQPLVPGAVLVVTHQGESAARKLDPNLVGTARMEADVDQAGVTIGEAVKLQTGVFDTFSFLLHGENLVLSAVLEEKILPIAIFWGRSMDHGHIFFDHLALLDCLGQSCRGLFGSGEDHDAAHVFIQPVDGENLAPKGLFQFGGNLCFGIQAHRLDANRQVPVGIKNVHKGLLCWNLYHYITGMGKWERFCLKKVKISCII